MIVSTNITSISPSTIINVLSTNYIDYHTGATYITGIVLTKTRGTSGVQSIVFPQDNTARNAFILYETALSDKDGKMILYNSEQNNFGGLSLHKQAKSFEILKEIDVVRLDNFNLSDISLIKIDVENHENEVLQGSKQTILTNKPIIVLENSYYYFSHIFPNPNPHEEFFKEL